MITIPRIRKDGGTILVIGSHPAIIQSILDFDFLSEKKSPSVAAIVTKNRKAEKYFFGTEELLIPCFASIPTAHTHGVHATWMLNLQSGRRALESTITFLETFPRAAGGHIFAEHVPEQHALALTKRYGEDRLILGPSGVGLLVPGALKLGAIGGIDPKQLKASSLTTRGSIAVISVSGGMTNELIRAVVGAGHRISFAATAGGDRFPITPLPSLFKLAQDDPETAAVAYFGELGGTDEYEVAAMIKQKSFTKPLVAYIAGIVDETFRDHVQFGHAKALVRQHDEGTSQKRGALRRAGVLVPDTFNGFLKALAALPKKRFREKTLNIEPLGQRKKSILSTREIALRRPFKGPPTRQSLTTYQNEFIATALEALFGRPVRSPITIAFTETAFTLLMDHGGHVSGAVNTMIAARAGKDLVSSLASGLLTIGPRFGGALNAAAQLWLAGAASHANAPDFVEKETRKEQLIPGIGHRKYRIGIPDPRVAELSEFTSLLKQHRHYDFARAVERVTTAKNGKLILNVDGAIAALLLDILHECEGFTVDELRELTNMEFFNAYFVIPRSIGFIAHFMEQKRNDEGLFRLPDDLLFTRGNTASNRENTKKRR